MNQIRINEIETAINRDYGNIAGMIVQKNGTKVYEKYFNGYTADNAVHVYSVTKSVLSALIGIAIDQGYIGSLDQKVLAFFPDYQVKDGEKTIQKITLKHLMTMTAPYKYETEPYELFFTSQNPIQDALDLLGGNGIIGEFNYSAIGGTHILAGILARATGQSILDFAEKYLFAPMGITVPHNLLLRSEEEHMRVMNDKTTRGWVVDPQGINTGSWGLFLTPEDMAKIGQLHLDGGRWLGKQLVSAAWIAESTKEHRRWDKLLYGYLWWIIDDQAHSFAALGDGGNVIYVNNKNNMVIAIASLLVPDARDCIELIKTTIEPAFENGMM
ncbi:beta-lactamase family protein [Acetobacterium wieringae]|uniref:6-aminohexanoate-dimer hydrolase n=1 Tax=Acetobacterium wieringae TaxID=52694 RepID=A0A1F2PJC9_9FIRM|nr:serine hydrolase [Acetobacterium wieringae]OFV71450.1 6-aminohexanoate-dimer hydrolase [Acetobacterium wieringae]UYO62717.1 beta-lactamase family protein [Acetobacterium wieringae]VUZ25065.1 6-aminohexanoate-dimer hydrolase [Acetobacterium wieringae]